MAPRSWRWAIALGGFVLALETGCSAFEEDPHPALPKLEASAWRHLHPEPASLLNEAYQQARQRPFDGEAVGRLAMTLHALSLREPAQRAYRRALSLQPKNPRLSYLYARLLTDDKAPLADQLAAWRQAYAANPSYFPARVALLEKLLEAQYLEQARQLAEEALQTDSPQPWSYYWAGRIRRQQGDLKAAIQFFLTALDLNPHIRPARVALAEAFRAAGELEKARSQEQLLAATSAQSSPAEISSDPYLEQLLAYQGPIAVAMETAHRAMQANRPLLAMNHYLAVLERDPQHAEAHTKLLQAASATGQFSALRAHYEKARQAGVNTAAVHLAWARALLAQNFAAEAEDLLHRAAQREPANAEVHSLRARALEKLKRRAEAEASYRKALQLDPNSSEARVGLARLIIHKNPAEAAELYEGALSQADLKETAIRLYELSDAYFRLRKYDLAVSRATRGQQLARSAKLHWLVPQFDRLIRRCRSGASSSQARIAG
ncbi:MAG: tetratricopeptide repeat protein [Bryobacteraceae bacterium]|nr:tetratricopeptide repeat protein [Bryobacteraceae bacterium]MDW8378378.1 tetratricopeptide repeat protein [Bryobacterales bacterium]